MDNNISSNQNNASTIINPDGRGRGLPPTPPAPTAQYREQDHYMPIANVIRVMRQILPPHAKISDEAKETVQECVSEFISFITEEANDRCHKEQRKTITADDLIWALGRLGFDNYVDPLSFYLQKYRHVEGDHRGGLHRNELGLLQRRPGTRFGLQGAGPSHAPAVMPPVPMIPHPAGLYGVVGRSQQDYFNHDGPSPSCTGSMDMGHDGSSPSPSPIMSSFDLPTPSASPSSTSQAEIVFFEPFTHFK